MQVTFNDRHEAGRQLAQRLRDYLGQDGLVLGIPRGGVAVGYEVARALHWPLEAIVPRKLPVPWSPEAGFGAIMPDGTRVLNREMVADLGLSQPQIDHIAEQVLVEVRRRETRYRNGRPEPEVAGRTVIIADDGLASGYTMLAAVRALRQQNPREVVVAVPVSPRHTALEVRRAADRLVVVYISDAVPFAVGMFYDSFHEVPDEEVVVLLERAAQEDAEERREAA